MQAINGIQNAMINTNAAAQGRMVVDAASAHRTYRHDERPVSKRPFPGVFVSKPSSDVASDSDCCWQPDIAVTGSETGTQTIGSSRTWRLNNRHLPEAAWAMLVLNRSLCG